MKYIFVGGVDVVLGQAHEVVGDDARKLLKMMEMLDDHDDVQAVSANFNIPDEALAELGG